MRSVAAALAAALLLLTACAGRQGPQAAQPVVLAAGSLSGILPELEPDARYWFDGSSGLVDQIAGGAPADVFASADEATMERAVAQGLIEGEPLIFATNHLVLVVPTGNPAGITGFDSSLDGAKLVVCSVEVPCGAATRRLAEANGLVLRPVSEEGGVTDVLGKVASGAADAGLVYATDAASSDDVETIEVPGAADDPNTYWVAVVRGADNPAEAREFVDRLVGEWESELQRSGFGAPPT